LLRWCRDCAHFLNPGCFEDDNEHGTGGRVGWALPTTGLQTFFEFSSGLARLSCYSRRMNETQLIQGRLISPQDIEQIRVLIENPKWHRTRTNDSAWQEDYFFIGDKWRPVRFKQISSVLWQGGAGNLPLRLIVIAPIPYLLSFHSRAFYRRPAYFLCDNLDRGERAFC